MDNDIELCHAAAPAPTGGSMNVRLTLRWKSGLEQSEVHPIDRAFALAELAQSKPDLAGFCLESEGMR